jgi:hypothetical protein
MGRSFHAGLNTSYAIPIPLLGSMQGDVDLEQLSVSPSLSNKAGVRNVIGAASNIAYQGFSAEARQHLMVSLRQKKKEIRELALTWAIKKILLFQAVAQSVIARRSRR